MERDGKRSETPCPHSYPEGREFLSVLGYPVAYMKKADIGGTGFDWWVFDENGEPIAGFEIKAFAYFYLANADLTLMVIH